MVSPYRAAGDRGARGEGGDVGDAGQDHQRAELLRQQLDGAPDPVLARRDPDRVSVLFLSDDFGGAWVQVDGTAEVLDLPEAVEPLVDYFRSISGEHPNWAEYRQAMIDQGKSLLRITPASWGPIATGGFPARLA
jgi:hypothetical protein